MILSGFPRLASDTAICGGRPVIVGTRVRVTDVLDMLADGATDSEILSDVPHLALADIRACLAFAASAANHPVVAAAE